jgi:hypothetical protein
MPVISKALLILAAVVVGWFAVDNYLSTRAELKTLRDDNQELSRQLKANQQQHNAESAVGQQGLAYGQQETANQEKTKIEIRTQIIKEPCAGQPVPDASADRLWKLATETRDAVLSGDARKSDGVTPAAAPGE